MKKEIWRHLDNDEANKLQEYYRKRRALPSFFLKAFAGTGVLAIALCIISGITEVMADPSKAVYIIVARVVGAAIMYLFFIKLSMFIQKALNKELRAIQNGEALICKGTVLKKNRQLTKSSNQYHGAQHSCYIKVSYPCWDIFTNELLEAVVETQASEYELINADDAVWLICFDEATRSDDFMVVSKDWFERMGRAEQNWQTKVGA